MASTSAAAPPGHAPARRAAAVPLRLILVAFGLLAALATALSPWLYGMPRAFGLIGALAGAALALHAGQHLLGARQHELAAPLATHHVLWIVAALALVIAPHAERLPLWLSAAAAALLGWRAWQAWRGMAGAAGPRALMIALVLATTAGVYAEYGTLLGRDAGVALLVMMLALKTLELRTPRDAVVIVFLGYFVVVTNFLYSQSIPTAVVMVAAVWLITTALVGLGHRTSGSGRQAMRLAARMLVQAVPLAALLFLLFPRVPGPLWGLPRDAQHGVTGLSEEMSPGSIASLGQSDEVAFRVQFEGAVPPTAQLYWRGPVFWNFDGRTWSGGGPPGAPDPEAIGARGRMVRYTTTIEPHYRRWLFALDLPVALPPDTRLNRDLLLLSLTDLRQRARYELVSALEYRTGLTLSTAERERALRLPAGSSPRALALAQRLRATAADDPAYVEAVLAMFRAEPYFYTLEPPLLGAQPVDEFLFDTRRGFCEHYASAFAVLMRAAGVPARIVTGYQGGVVNPIGQYLVVRQAEAHAWVEVWLPGRGWVRVDPTAAVSPTRIESGVAAAVPQGEPLPLSVRGDIEWLRRLQFAWDAANNRWNLWVLGYNRERQRALLGGLGFDATDWRRLVALLGLASAAAVLLLVLLTLAGLHRRREEPALRLYRQYCERLARAGVVREAWEGPQQFAARAIAARPELAQPIGEVTRLYVALRYGSPPPDPAVTGRQLAALRRSVRALGVR